MTSTSNCLKLNPSIKTSVEKNNIWNKLLLTTILLVHLFSAAGPRCHLSHRRRLRMEEAHISGGRGHQSWNVLSANSNLCQSHQLGLLDECTRELCKEISRSHDSEPGMCLVQVILLQLFSGATHLKTIHTHSIIINSKIKLMWSPILTQGCANASSTFNRSAGATTNKRFKKSVA